MEKKMAGRQGREDLIKKGLLEMMEQGKWAGPGRAGPRNAELGVARGSSKPIRVEWKSEQSGVQLWLPDLNEASVGPVRTHGSAPGPLRTHR